MSARPKPPSEEPAQDLVLARTQPLAEVTPLGLVERVALTVVAGHLQTLLELPTRVAPAWPEPAYAFLAHRRQYDAGVILKTLAAETPPGLLRVAVTAGDLCLPIFTHVYGEARLGARVAVVSLHRLGGEEGGPPPERELVYTRLAKVALHEASHGLGLTHCQTPGCLMGFSQGLAQLDQRGMEPCPACLADLRFRRRLLDEGWDKDGRG